MSGARTEKPTAKRLADSRRRGEVAVSRELTSAVALVAGLAATVACSESLVGGLARHLRASLAGAVAGDAAPSAAMLSAAVALGRAAAVPLVAAAAASLLCGAAQTRGLFAPAAVAPQWRRVNPVSGLKRIVSADQLGLLAVGLLEAAAVAALAWTSREELAAAASALLRVESGAGLLAALPAAILPWAWQTAAALLVFGVVDLLLARRRHLRSLRMTRDEVLREHKEQDGDPQLKAERRAAHRALASRAAPARATCVVVNPTHVAVALHHDPASESAPVVLAKGEGDAARRIRADAVRAAVPIVRDVALARALFRLADVGEEIPEELYQAAAAVLVHVHGLGQEGPP